MTKLIGAMEPEKAEENLTAAAEPEAEPTAEDGVPESESSTTPNQARPPLDPKSMARILDLPLNIAVRMGDSRMNIENILQLGQGSIIELEKMAGEPLDIFVNGVLMARGEAVIVNEHMGIRVTEVIPHSARVSSLGSLGKK